MDPRNKPAIGLTGGIASGKSAVATILRELGVGVVDADQIAREIVEPGTEALDEIVATFGKGVLDDTGSLDRERLGKLVFNDDSLRRQLQAITHPRIGALSIERMIAVGRTESPYAVYEAALLVESGAYNSNDAVIVVATPPSLQIKRVVERDGLSEDEAKRRLHAQLPLEKKLEVADYIIRNEGSFEELRKTTQEVHDGILKRFGLS